VASMLLAYSWPGNIRELENCMERMTVLSKGGLIRSEDFPHRVIKEISLAAKHVKISPVTEQGMEYFGNKNQKSEIYNHNHPEIRPDSTIETLKDSEKKQIDIALKKNSGNLNKTAQMLGIHRNTLRRKINELGLKSLS